MVIINTIVSVGWILFWGYWIVMAATAKKDAESRNGIGRAIRLSIVILILLIIKLSPSRLRWSQHDIATQLTGLGLFAIGLLTAIWARVYLAKNWGMPMSKKVDTQLITMGPYRLMRHPIYTGIMLAMFGTALATTPYWFIAFAVFGVYFVWSAVIEERIMTKQFPEVYSDYRRKSKMFLPFIF